MPKKTANKTSKKPLIRRIIRRRIIIPVFLLIVIVSGVMLIKFLNGPAIATIHSPVRQAAPASAQGYKQATGKQMVFSYPDYYVKKPNQAGQTTPDSLERYVFKGKKGSSNTLAVTLQRLPSGLLTDSSAYNLRHNQPSQYLEQKRAVNSTTIVVLSNKSQFEKVAFWQHRDVLATIALSSNTIASPSLDKEFTAMLESWQWK